MERDPTVRRPWTVPWAVEVAAVFVAIAACFWVSSRASLAYPLWMDDLITVAISESSSLTHVFDAVWRGLDNTPPFYNVLGWLLHGLLPAGMKVANALRVANAVFLVATLCLLYQIAREFLPRHFAAICICVILALEQRYFTYVLVEVRTYALFVGCATLCLYVAIKDVAKDSKGPSFRTATCLLMLTASHTFGIVYACTLVFAAVAVLAAQQQWSKVKTEALCLAPSVFAVVAWVPVFRHQAQIPSWIPKPSLVDFFAALRPPHSPLAVLALTTCTALSLAFLGIMYWRSGRGVLAIDPRISLLMALPIFTFLTMAAIWCESWVGFRVFHPRYFGYNILLVFAAVLVCAVAARQAMPAIVSHGRPILAVACFGLCADLLIVPLLPEDRIPCLDPITKSFAEDNIAERLPVLAPISVSWLPRVRRPGREVLFAADDHFMSGSGVPPEYYANSQAYAREYEAWAGTDSMRSDAQLAMLSSGFLVVEDGLAPWLRHAVAGSDFTVSLQSRSSTCRLWKVLPAQNPH